MRASSALLSFLCSCAYVGTAWAQAPAAPSTQDVQSRFNAATDAWAADDCATALPIFAGLAQDARFRPGSLPYAAIAVRRGDCMVQTGNFDQGEAQLLAGLPRLRAAGADFAQEVGRAEGQLAALAIRRWDHDGALAHVNAALATQTGAARLGNLARLAQVTSFDGGRTALDAIDEALNILSKEPDVGKPVLAPWYNLRGRVLLNQGQAKEAMSALRKAFDLTGGEKATLSLSDTFIRADLAQAAMLAHDSDQAYRYMAQTGAGRLPKSPFSTARWIHPPACGVESGLEPDDVAVVEFTIADDGTVARAQPVYGNGSYAKAATFARAVQGWRWQAEDAANIPAFFRYAARVELRCTRSEGGGGMSPLEPLRQRFAQWALPLMPPYQPRPVEKVEWLTLAEAAQKAGDGAAELGARVLLAVSDLRRTADVLASIDGARELASGANIPAEARHAALVILTAARPHTANHDKSDVDRVNDPAMLALAADGQVASDALAVDTALLLGTPRRPKSAETDQALTNLRKVAEDQRLGEHHPLRQFAQLRLANDIARKGDLAQAQSYFAATGLTQEQCALIGPKPALTNSGNGSAFPLEALRYGFEGWVQIEFDISAKGRAVDSRALVSYPPFIFTKSATVSADNVQYQSSYRPSGGQACAANLEMVRFTIPGNTNTVSTVKPKTPPKSS
jgi:tetratricopeptide (TPR) repeat protein